MALFGFGRKPLTDEQLRDALFDAAAAKDEHTLTKLWSAESDRIRRLFLTWSTLPPHIREDPARRKWWADGVVGAATVALQAGDQTLLTALQGDPDANVIVRWARVLGQARASVGRHASVEALQELETILAETRGMTGPAVDDLLPKTFGVLGETHFWSGDLCRARACTLLALERCRIGGDQEGIDVYARNLVQMEWAPPTSFKRADGRRVIDGSLASCATSYCEVQEGCPVPRASITYHARGREARHAGEYERAIDLLTASAVLAPQWAYPFYDRASTHLMAGHAASALNDYRYCLELSGRSFFQAITAVHTLQRERDGELAEGTWRAFVALQHNASHAGLARRDALRRFVTQVPTFAPAWLQYSQLEPSPARRLATLEQGFAATPDSETAGMLQIHKALALSVAEPELAQRMLMQLEDDGKATHGTRDLAGVLRTLVAPPQSDTAHEACGHARPS